MIAPVQTSSFSPAWNGELPSTFCRYWLMKKIEPNMPKYIASDTTFVTAKLRRLKKAIGSIGSELRSSWATNATSSTTPAASEMTTSTARPAERLGADQPEDQAEQAGGCEPESGQVEPALGAVALLEPACGGRSERESDGHVDPEDPVPGAELDHGAADERAERDGDPADPRPDAERETALLRREGVGQQRQRQRRHDRAADALQRAGRDQQAHVGRQRRSGRGDGEQDDPEDEHAAAPEAVAERGAGQQQHRIGKDVGVDDPLERLDRRVQVAVDAGQRDADDEVVQDDHEKADRDKHQRPDATARCNGFCGWHGVRSLA